VEAKMFATIEEALAVFKTELGHYLYFKIVLGDNKDENPADFDGGRIAGMKTVLGLSQSEAAAISKPIEAEIWKNKEELLQKKQKQ